MKVAIIGSRTFSDMALMDQTLKTHLCTRLVDCAHWNAGYWPRFDEVISGGAKGADQLSAQWVRARAGWAKAAPEVKLTEYLPDWERYGKRAGFIRNEDIVKSADMVVAFWDSVSKGTQNSLSIAKRLKIPTLVIYF